MTTRDRSATRPVTITVALAGYLVSTLSALVSAIVLGGYHDQIVDTLRTADARSGNRLTGAQLDHAATVLQAAGITVLLVIAAVYLLLAFRLRAGRNWARIVLTVITLFQIVSLIVARGTVLSYVSAAIAVIALVSAYLPASNDYIRQVKQARRL